MKILVTGATGFTGSHLVANLVGDGHEVKAFVRPSSNISHLQELKVEIIYGDITDLSSVEKAVKGSEVVFHLAAIYRNAGVPNSLYRKVNVDGTDNVMKASLKYGVERVIHCSTVGVHGHITQPPANEETAFNPGDIYQRSKLEGEKLAFSYYKTKGLPVIILRPTGIYGPGDLRLLKFFKLVKKGFFFIGSGNIFYHLTFIRDLINGFKLCMTNPKAVGEIFIIGGNEYTTLNQLAKIIAVELGVSEPLIHLPAYPFYLLGWLCESICVPLKLNPPLYRRRIDFFTKDRAFDISKANRILNYYPLVNLEKGIHITTEWYKTNNYL